jgi:5-methylcytosine-specific restriction endonuclease McrA
MSSWYVKYLKAQISRIWRWSPERRKALKRAEVGRKQWKCEQCEAQPLGPYERDVDHIIPKDAVGGWDSWDNYIKRALEVRAEGLVVKCKPCHQKKTNSENAERRKGKKK